MAHPQRRHQTKESRQLTAALLRDMRRMGSMAVRDAKHGRCEAAQRKLSRAFKLADHSAFQRTRSIAKNNFDRFAKKTWAAIYACEFPKKGG